MAEKKPEEKGVEKKKRELAKLISQIKGVRGSGTELISVYIPSEYPIAETANKLRGEYGQAGNIKSKMTRKNVQAALEKILQYLKVFRQTPKNGLAIFCGNISKDPGKEDMELFAISPPDPILISTYRCDSEFLTEPLESLGGRKERYGLVTLDGNEATLGVLEGQVAKVVRRLNYTGPSKTHKGGSCIHEDAKTQLENGRIISIKEVREGDKLLSFDFEKNKACFSECNAVMKRNSDYAYHIVTKNPHTEVITTGEHLFFVLTEDDIEEKPASEIKLGDRLIHAASSPVIAENKKFELELPSLPVVNEGVREVLKSKRKELGMTQSEVAKSLGVSQMVISHLETGNRKMRESMIFPKLISLYRLKSSFLENESIVCTPKEFTAELCQFMGYILGDGTLDGTRIIVYDSDKNILETYKEIIGRSFGLEAVLRKPKENMYELRMYNKWLAEAMNKRFPELFLESTERDIPNIILELPDEQATAFVRGLFDAEGFVTTRIGIGMRSRRVIEKLRFLLLRWGIISSYYWKKTDENGVFFLEINDSDSLFRFVQKVGFGSQRKQTALESIKRRANRTRQVPISGKYVLKLARTLGLNTMNFPNINMFFSDKRRMSLSVFNKNVMPTFRNLAALGNKEAKNILHMLDHILNSEAVFPKVASIEKIKKDGNFFDLCIDNTENFVVNGLVVHNSALRYDRTVLKAKEEYYNRVGDAMDTILFASGIDKVIVGGPGPIKDIFLKAKPFNYQFKILGVIDIGYVDDYGIQELARKAVDVIAEEQTMKSKKAYDKFMKEIVKGGLATYGVKEVVEAVETGRAETLILSEKFSIKRAKLKCKQCGTIEDRFIEERQEYSCGCGGDLEIIEEVDLFDELFDKAEEKGMNIEVISAETSEGAQFLKGFKGIGALLKY